MLSFLRKFMAFSLGPVEGFANVFALPPRPDDVGALGRDVSGLICEDIKAFRRI